MHEERLERALEYLQSKGNTQEEACNLLAQWLNDITLLIQPGIFSKEYTQEQRERKNIARVQLRQLPEGEKIIKAEKKFMGVR